MLLFVSCGKSNPPKVVTGVVGYASVVERTISVEAVCGNRRFVPGVLSKKCGKTMAFIRLEIGDVFNIEWYEDQPDKSEKWYIAEFDTKELDGLGKHVKGIKFTYLDNQKWKVGIHGTTDMEEKDIIKTIFSKSFQEIPARVGEE